MLIWLQNHLLEIFGALSGVLFVFLEIRQNIWLWPVGIITSAIYIIVFYNTGFYADMGLQWYYLFISIFGWYWWIKGGKKGSGDKLEISGISKGLFIKLFFITLITFIAIWFILEEYTDSVIPGWDAFTTAVSITATWMLARKIIEHWILWIIVNIVSMGLYIYKGLYPTVVLFSVYTIMAFFGFSFWRRDMNTNTPSYG